MSKKRRLILYLTVLLISLATFILCIFVFQRPDGIPGLVLCILCILLIFGSTVKLCKLIPGLDEGIFDIIDILFMLP